MKNILIFILIFCFLLFPFRVLARQVSSSTPAVVKIPTGFSLFWDGLIETIRLFFAWGSVDKVRLALNFADKKLKAYKQFRAIHKDKLAARSLKGYQKEINTVLEVLEKEKNPQKSEQIAEEVRKRVLKNTAELELLYDQAPASLKQRISQIISISKTCYQTSIGLMSGEYRETVQSKWSQFKAKIYRTIKNIYYKLWPISH